MRYAMYKMTLTVSAGGGRALMYWPNVVNDRK